VIWSSKSDDVETVYGSEIRFMSNHLMHFMRLLYVLFVKRCVAVYFMYEFINHNKYIVVQVRTAISQQMTRATMTTQAAHIGID